MSVVEEEIRRTAKQLSEAWMDYCDLDSSGQDRIAELRARYRRPPASQPSPKDKHRDAEAYEAFLKHEFLLRIRHGEFEVFGRDITTDLGAPLIKLPQAIFDPTLDDFRADWDRSEVRSKGRELIEIHVRPVVTSLSAGAEAAKERSKGGRPNKVEELEEACRIALERDPKFCALQVKQALPIVNRILKTDLKTPKGFEDGAHPETLRRAKNRVCGKS